MKTSLRDKIDNFFYNGIVRPIIFTSRLGRKTMFGYANSGINFDHIYGNKAKGYTRFGKIIDKILLRLPACKATQNRKEKIITILNKEIQKNISLNKKTRIVDIASGPARYLVDLIAQDMTNNIEALCFDIDMHSLDYGKKIAGDKPILYKKSDVLKIGGHHKFFSKKKDWKPNVIIASGFFEYINDETSVAILKNILDFLEKDGFLLLITQKDSPNRKLIEHVGITNDKKKWVLFYRDQKIVEGWLTKLGYQNVVSEIDPWNMYVFYEGRKYFCE